MTQSQKYKKKTVEIVIILTIIIFISNNPVQGENRFFYSEYENLLKRMETEDSPEFQMYMNTARQQEIEIKWSYPDLPPDYYTHQIPELNYAVLEQGLLRSAYSYYENAIILMEKMRAELFQMDGKIKSVKSNVWWKEIDEIEELHRKRNRIKIKYSLNLSDTAGKAINILEGIQNSRVRSERAYINLYFQLLRMFIIYEVMMGNYDIAYPSLVKYKTNPDSEYEWPYHYLLSRSYRYKYLTAKNNTGVREDELNMLRNMKNVHLLISIYLRYGFNSEEYRTSKNKVYLEELGSPRN